jgi:lipopolysaccharide biosynthesis glycosyltransferase
MNLLYTCIFDNLDYLKLLELLLVSGVVFGGFRDKQFDFLIITTQQFEKNINEMFSKYGLNVRIKCIQIDNIFSALSARFRIFDFVNKEYNKILYIDTDILITKNLSILFNLPLENKIYTLQEGIISDYHHGKEFFDFSKINPHTPGFTSGIILFKNCTEIKDLFNTINNNIEINIKTNGIKPIAYDQAFLNYYAIITGRYNNTLLIEYTINNPAEFKYNYVLCHFPGGVGNFTNKLEKMSNYFLYLYDSYNFKIINNNKCCIKKKYNWKHDMVNVSGFLEFNDNNELITPWGNGTYEILNGNYVKTFWYKDCHLLIFYDNFQKFISIRRIDNNISLGEVI